MWKDDAHYKGKAGGKLNTNEHFNPIRPENQGYHQPIEMKLCVSHYSHKRMPDSKFESGSFSISGDMTSQNFPLQKGTSHRIWIFTHRKWV